MRKELAFVSHPGNASAQAHAHSRSTYSSQHTHPQCTTSTHVRTCLVSLTEDATTRMDRTTWMTTMTSTCIATQHHHRQRAHTHTRTRAHTRKHAHTETRTWKHTHGNTHTHRPTPPGETTRRDVCTPRLRIGSHHNIALTFTWHLKWLKNSTVYSVTQ